MAKRVYEDVSIDNMFGDTTDVYESPTTRSTGARKISQFFTLILFSTLLLSLLVIPTALTGYTAVKAAQPITDIWKRMPSSLPDVAIAARNTIYDKNGGVIAQTWTEDRTKLGNIKDINDNAVHALVSTEDANFYKNKGIDLKGTLRAALSGSGGGSGITQQLMKNLQYYNVIGNSNKNAAIEQSYVRKIRELKLATEYEKTHTKDQILLDYFNTVAFGGPSVYGIETASQYFFGKPAKQLSLAEASALIGTANNPVIYNMNSSHRYDYWKARQSIVLNSMVRAGYIKQSEADAAKNVKLNIVKKRSKNGTCYSSKYPFYCDYVMNSLLNNPRLGKNYDERAAIIAKGGLQIKTYMDPSAMSTIDNYMQKNWGEHNDIIAPTALIQPGTGGVVAMGVNRNYGFSKGDTTLNLPNTKSGEGSVYKMITLATALTQGHMNESDLAFSSDCPLYPGRKYDAPAGGFRNSEGCGGRQSGYLNYKQATGYSSNTWFVTLEMMVGVNKIKEFSKSVGLAAPSYIDNRSLSYTLGSVANSPIQLAAAFATFANKGIYCPPNPIQSFQYEDGSSPAIPDNYDPKSQACRRVMSPQAAGIVLKAMRADVSGEVKNAFGIPANIPGMDNGGKSGTNQLFNSSWAQLTGYYAIFTNVYNDKNYNTGIDGAVFKGEPTPWNHNTAQSTGSDLMKQLNAGKKNIPLLWDTDDNSIEGIPVDENAFFVIPNVMGMQPSDALATLQAAGVQANVSKDTITKEGYRSGVVADQSLAPGTKLAKGTKQQIILKVTK